MVDRGFQDERLAAQLGMPENPLKAVASNVPGADVRMPVEPRAQETP